MNYRHIYHAGNFADVLKHMALVAVLLHLRKKEKPFAVIDTHAGSGLYDLASDEANKTAEAMNGISKVLQAGAPTGALQTYCDIVRAFGDGRYPGSPLIAAKLLRPQDRLVAIELQPEEYAALATALGREPRTRAVQGDGYRQLISLLPPPERRGVVLIDPAYEADEEFVTAARALVNAHRRFGTGIFLFWYPLKARGLADAAIGEIRNAGLPSILRIELDIGAAENTREDREPLLSAAGLLVVNPPFGFEAEMSAVLPFLTEILAQGPRPRFRLEWLAGGP